MLNSTAPDTIRNKGTATLHIKKYKTAPNHVLEIETVHNISPTVWFTITRKQAIILINSKYIFFEFKRLTFRIYYVILYILLNCHFYIAYYIHIIQAYFAHIHTFPNQKADYIPYPQILLLAYFLPRFSVLSYH